MSNIDLRSHYRKIPPNKKMIRGAKYLPWGPAWRALKENYPGSFDRYSSEITPNKKIVVVCALTVSDGEHELVHVERVSLDKPEEPLVNTEKRALVKAIARATGLAFHLYEKEDAEYQSEPEPAEPDKTLPRLAEQCELLGGKENIPDDIAVMARSSDAQLRQRAVKALDSLIESRGNGAEKWTVVGA